MDELQLILFACLQKGEVTPENKAACSDFIMLLTDALDFAEWAKVKLLTTGERLVHTTAFFLLAIVYSCLQMRFDNMNTMCICLKLYMCITIICSNESHVDALKEHESKAIELHLNVLNMLQEITNSSTRVHARITPRMSTLVYIF